MALEKSEVEKVLNYRWAVFGILAFAYFFVYFHRVSTAVVSTDLQTTFGVGAASIALLSSAYFYAYTIMQLPSGLLTDSWGPRKTVSMFTLVAAAGAILTGVASTFELVIAGRLLIGVGVAMVYIPIMKILAAWYRKNEFASLSGILLAVGNIGALSAAGPLALMSDALGWQQVFIILGVITFALAVLAWKVSRLFGSEGVARAQVGELPVLALRAAEITACCETSHFDAASIKPPGRSHSTRMVAHEAAHQPPRR
jgi:sugar phosphate permease